MASTIPIQPPSKAEDSDAASPLPHLLQTPSGLALLELQGTINLPSRVDEEPDSSQFDPDQVFETPFGRLVFPEYDGDAGEGRWMKRVFLFVGKHQRLHGEVKTLPKALAVMRRKAGDESNEELEIVEIVKHKIIFSHRPEPVGDDIPEV